MGVSYGVFLFFYFFTVQQILVTHHVELVLPGAHYVVRMLDGRIDTQGTVKELRAQGVLDDIAHDSTVHVRTKPKDSPVKDEPNEDSDDSAKLAKEPRKFIKDEHREIGGVKWSIYNTYLKASYVSSLRSHFRNFVSGFDSVFTRSYWTWGFLCCIIVVTQV